MIQRIEASNFKCFKDISLEMSNLNLLSGINSMGKSTIIQMLLLLRQSYEQNALEKGIYLNGAMEFLNSKECVDEELMEQQFIRVMRYSRIIMGKYAFRKLGENGMRRPINKAIYEAWCRSMFVLNDSELKKLAEEKKEVYKRFMKLCNDEVFLQIIKASDKKSFLFRFTRIENLLRGVLDDTKNRSIEF